MEDLFEQLGKALNPKNAIQESDFKSELDILLQGYSITPDSLRKSLINNIYKLHEQYPIKDNIDRNKELPFESNEK